MSLILILWDRDQSSSYLYVFLTATAQTSLSLSLYLFLFFFFFCLRQPLLSQQAVWIPEPSAPFSSPDIGWFQWSEAEIDAETGRLLFKS